MASIEFNRAVTPDTSNGAGTTGFLPKGSAKPAGESVTALHDILASNDNSWDLPPRVGVIADDDNTRSFTGTTVSWDAHVYFDGADARSTARALQLRLDTLSTFPDLTVNRPYRAPIGPHPTSMWSVELHTPDQFAKYLPWLCTANGGLSVLVSNVTASFSFAFPYCKHFVGLARRCTLR